MQNGDPPESRCFLPLFPRREERGGERRNHFAFFIFNFAFLIFPPVLKKTKRSAPQPAGGHFAIVASSYNRRYVDGMMRAAEKCLRAARAETIKIVRVPGAYEIPVVAARLARAHEPPLDAI